MMVENDARKMRLDFVLLVNSMFHFKFDWQD